jgi:hypothetical protein
MELIQPRAIQQLNLDTIKSPDVKHWSIDSNDTTASEEQSPKIPNGTNIETTGTQSVATMKDIEFIIDPGMVDSMRRSLPMNKAVEDLAMNAKMYPEGGYNLMKYQTPPEGTPVERQAEAREKLKAAGHGAELDEGKTNWNTFTGGRAAERPGSPTPKGKYPTPGPRGGISGRTGDPWRRIVYGHRGHGGAHYANSLTDRIASLEKQMVESIGLKHTGKFVPDEEELKPEADFSLTPEHPALKKEAMVGGRHKVYLKPGEESPMGYKKFQGENGGAYYLARPYDEIRSEKPSRGPRGGEAGVSEGGERLSQVLRSKYPGIKLKPAGENQYEYSWKPSSEDGEDISTISGRGDLSEIDRKIEDDMRIRTQRRSELQGQITSRVPSSMPTEHETRSFESRKNNPNRPVKAAVVDLDEGTGKWNVGRPEVQGSNKAFRSLSRDENSPMMPDRMVNHAKKIGATHYVNPYTGTKGPVDLMQSLEIAPEVGYRVKSLVLKNEYLMGNNAPDSTDAELQKFDDNKLHYPPKMIKANEEYQGTPLASSDEMKYQPGNYPEQPELPEEIEGANVAGEKISGGKPTINPASVMSKESTPVAKPYKFEMKDGGGVGTTSSGAAMTPTFGGGGSKLSKKIKFFIGKMEQKSAPTISISGSKGDSTQTSKENIKTKDQSLLKSKKSDEAAAWKNAPPKPGVTRTVTSSYGSQKPKTNIKKSGQGPEYKDPAKRQDYLRTLGKKVLGDKKIGIQPQIKSPIKKEAQGAFGGSDTGMSIAAPITKDNPYLSKPMMKAGLRKVPKAPTSPVPHSMGRSVI